MTDRIALKCLDANELRTELVRSLAGTVSTALSSADFVRIMDSAQLASFAHHGQTRKWRDGYDRPPYIEHPLRVALRLVRWGVTDADVLCAALLHDVVEDSAQLLADSFGRRGVAHTAGDPATDAALDVVSHYGDTVRALVRAVTNLPGDTGSYLAKVARISGTPAALLIKASDMVDNAGSLPHQAGHVSDEFISKRVTKYAPALEILGNALDNEPPSPVNSAAAEHIARVSRSLVTL